MSQSDTPSNRNDSGGTSAVTALNIARRYYSDGQTKSEIAKSLGLSRFKVARVIDSAMASGLVEIVFHPPKDGIDYELSAALQHAYGLRHTVVLQDDGLAGDALLEPLGRATSALLHEIVGDDDVLGFAWTRTLEVMKHSVGSLRAKAVVQLCGAYPGAGEGPTAIEIVRDIARMTGGRPYVFYAPLVASDAQAAAAMHRQAEVLAANDMVAHVTKALVTIGSWSQGQSSVWNAVSPAMREEVTRAGAVAEICGSIYLDANGREVRCGVNALTLGVEASALARIPDVIGVAFDVAKAKATAAALRSKLVRSVITHAKLARELVQLAQGSGQA